jgi:hypothetical protein
MDNSTPDLPEPELEPQPELQPENQSETQAETQPETQPETQSETQPFPEKEADIYVNERVKQAFDRVKMWFKNAKDYYRRSPRLRGISYQGKFLPAFWTVACIFSLLVNIILVAALISVGHHFFELKALVSDGLVNGLSNNLALMDKAHIVTTVPVQTTVQLKDNLPVVFNLPIKQNTQLSLAQASTITGAYIYLNGAQVSTDLTLPAGTPIQINFDITIPVSQSVPVDITVPVSLLVPLDLAIDQTDLHQSIVGLQTTIEPYRTILGSTFNSQSEISLCSQWWAGWLCRIFFGKQ